METLITNLDGKFRKWKQYFEDELFYDSRPGEHMESKVQNPINKQKKQQAQMTQNY